MEYTKIEPEQTVADIQRVLGKYGASAILTQYNGGEVTAVSFEVHVGEKRVPFRLPCRWQAIEQILLSRKRARRTERLTQQAKRVAWRQILRWIQAQLALVETNMVKLQEVFMPYLQLSLEGKTLYQELEETKFRMLEHKEK